MDLILYILLMLLIFSTSFVAPLDTDFGWHLRCGVELWQGHPCLNNTFSYYLAQYHAYYGSFVFDAITAIIYRFTGMTGISIAHALVMTFTGYLFTRNSKQPRLVASICFILAILISGSILNLGWRPQIISYSLVLFTYIILNQFLDGEKNSQLRYIYSLPLLLLVWVNTHMGFFTGVILLLFASLETVQKLVKKPDSMRLRRLFQLSIVSIGALIATLLNPFGYKVYIEIYRHTQSPLASMIAEWVPPSPLHQIAIGTAVIMYFAVVWRQKKWSFFSTVSLLFFAYLAVTARRNLPIFYTLVLFEIVRLLPAIRINPKKIGFIFIPILGAILIFVSVIRIVPALKIDLHRDSYCANNLINYPCGILDQQKNLTGNIFAPYEYGGFIIWQYPGLKVFVDGRMPAWKNDMEVSPYQTFLAVVQAQTGWSEYLKKINTRYILTQKGTFLAIDLDQNAERYGWVKIGENQWHLLYRATP